MKKVILAAMVLLAVSCSTDDKQDQFCGTIVAKGYSAMLEDGQPGYYIIIKKNDDSKRKRVENLNQYQVGQNDCI